MNGSLVFWILDKQNLLNDFSVFLFLIFCPKVASTINTKQEYCPIGGCIKEDSFMEKLQPKKYVPCALILVFKVQYVSERVILELF